MKNTSHIPQGFTSLAEAFKSFGFPAPQHPLIALINGIDQSFDFPSPQHRHVLNFYKISLRPFMMGETLNYGQTNFDFKEGGMLFAAPNQIVGSDAHADIREENGCMNQQITLLIHPDFLLNYPLANKIKTYKYFSYATNEALHLSDKEKETITSVFRIIEDELNSRIDEFSHDVVIAQIELLLSYANRFYKRQFITRKPISSNLLQEFEEILNDRFDKPQSLDQGIPTVQYFAEQLNLSSGYLSDMLRSLTGQNTQQHIHNKLIEKAKEKLSTTELSVSEIAFDLGFEHPQSFSRLFKRETERTPTEFRQSFN